MCVLPAEPPAGLAVSDAPALSVIQVVKCAELEARKDPVFFCRRGHAFLDQGIPSIPRVLSQMQLILILCGAKVSCFEQLYS